MNTKRLSTVAVVTLVIAQWCAAQASDLPAQTRATMVKATDFIRSISAEGGYLWKYAADMSRRAGEEIAQPTQVWVQPPGTPAAGGVFLRAYLITKDKRYLDASRAAADVLARGQLESGGWDYSINFTPQAMRGSRYRVNPPSTQPANRNTSTYDDDNTQSALKFLIEFVQALKTAPADPRDARIRETLDYGLKKLMEAQYPIGAWPQRWDGTPHDPAKFPILKASIPTEYPRTQPNGSYYQHYTFNDDTLRDCIQTLLNAHKATGKAEFFEAAKRGADFILLAQLPEPQPVWAQQYDAAMHPAWARAFEPPSVTSRESFGVMNMLVDFYLQIGDEKYIKPVPAAIAWFKRSQIAPDRWARLYELTTNKPIYGDRDKAIHYTLEEITEERRTGYSWQNSYGGPAIIAHVEAVMKAGREKWIKDHAAPETREQKLARAAQVEPAVRQIIAELDEKGRWLQPTVGRPFVNVAGPWIDMDRYERNMNTLCEYLEMVQQ